MTEPTILATCTHCGVPIYTRSKDARGLPIPEYICTCRFLAAAASAPIWSVIPYVPLPYPQPNPPSWTPWQITYFSETIGTIGTSSRLQAEGGAGIGCVFTPSDVHIRAGLSEI